MCIFSLSELLDLSLAVSKQLEHDKKSLDFCEKCGDDKSLKLIETLKDDIKRNNDLLNKINNLIKEP